MTKIRQSLFFVTLIVSGASVCKAAPVKFSMFALSRIEAPQTNEESLKDFNMVKLGLRRENGTTNPSFNLSLKASAHKLEQQENVDVSDILDEVGIGADVSNVSVTAGTGDVTFGFSHKEFGAFTNRSLAAKLGAANIKNDVHLTFKNTGLAVSFFDSGVTLQSTLRFFPVELVTSLGTDDGNNRAALGLNFERELNSFSKLTVTLGSVLKEAIDSTTIGYVAQSALKYRGSVFGLRVSATNTNQQEVGLAYRRNLKVSEGQLEAVLEGFQSFDSEENETKTTLGLVYRI